MAGSLPSRYEKNLTNLNFVSILNFNSVSNEWQVLEIKKALAEADSSTPDQFVANDAVLAWMETWGTDHEGDTPVL